VLTRKGTVSKFQSHSVDGEHVRWWRVLKLRALKSTVPKTFRHASRRQPRFWFRAFAQEPGYDLISSRLPPLCHANAASKVTHLLDHSSAAMTEESAIPSAMCEVVPYEIRRDLIG